jgi:hypothetical protein
MMLGSDKSRGYCLEMICADFLAGANLDSGQPDVLLHSLSHFYRCGATAGDASSADAG